MQDVPTVIRAQTEKEQFDVLPVVPGKSTVCVDPDAFANENTLPVTKVFNFAAVKAVLSVVTDKVPPEAVKPVVAVGTAEKLVNKFVRELSIKIPKGVPLVSWLNRGELFVTLTMSPEELRRVATASFLAYVKPVGSALKKLYS